MLEELMAQWNAALNGEKKVQRTERQRLKDKEIITFQDILFKFRDTDVHLYVRLVGSPKTTESLTYSNELFVPSTNKSMQYQPNKMTKAQLMSAILCLFTKGREHEDRLMARKIAAIKNANARLLSENVAKLEGTTFNEDEIADIRAWVDENTVQSHVMWNAHILNAIATYHQYVTGRGLIELGIDLGNEIGRHLGRCFSTAAYVLTEARVGSRGLTYVTNTTIKYHFLDPKDNVTYPIYVVRSFFSKLYDMIYEANSSEASMIFPHLLRLLAHYWEQRTGYSLAEEIQKIKIRKDAYRNRQENRKFNSVQQGSRKPSGMEQQAPSQESTSTGPGVMDEVSDWKKKNSKKFRRDKYEEDDFERKAKKQYHHERESKDDDFGSLADVFDGIDLK